MISSSWVSVCERFLTNSLNSALPASGIRAIKKIAAALKLGEAETVRKYALENQVDPLPYLVAQADEPGPIRQEQIPVNRHAVDEVIDAQPGQQLSGTPDLQGPLGDGDDDGRRRPVAPVDIGVDNQLLENLCWNLRQAATQDRTFADAQVPDGLDHVLAGVTRCNRRNSNAVQPSGRALVCRMERNPISAPRCLIR